MRKVLLSLLIISPTVFGGDQFFGNIHWAEGSCVGNKVNPNRYLYQLSSFKKCNLPIVNAEHMRTFIVQNPVIQYSGCWGETLGGKALLIYEDGRSETMDLIGFEEVKVDKNGNGIVIASKASEKEWSKCPSTP